MWGNLDPLKPWIIGAVMLSPLVILIALPIIRRLRK